MNLFAQCMKSVTQSNPKYDKRLLIPNSFIGLVVIAAFIILPYVTFYFVIAPSEMRTSQESSVIELPKTGGVNVRMFTTRDEYTGDLGGVSGADQKCVDLAAESGMGGEWKALISSSTQDIKDIMPDEAYIRLDGQVVANDKADLFDGTLDNPILLDQHGFSFSRPVWTGTLPNGSAKSNTCNDWTDGGSGQSTERGDSSAVDQTWVHGNVALCSLPLGLFCYEDIDADYDGYPYSKDCNDDHPGIYPGAAEVCDNLDNNCNGTVDENISRECGTDAGECTKGTETCTAGAWGVCVGSVFPATELCDNKDNDCDGTTDEDLTQACGTSEGICTTGVKQCVAGIWGNCSGVQPKTETCDNLDNDCDGQIDEGCSCETGSTQSCGSTIGECRAGTQWCEDGQWGICKGALGPRSEVCDGVDNDCDGTVDENLSRSCGSSIGVCQPGTQVCAESEWGTCEGEIAPVEELCDGLDNNCDGTLDEGCSCDSGDHRVCGTDVGECKKGEQICTDGLWGSCSGGILAEKEICDEKDNDCDGQVDEGYICEEEESKDMTNEPSSQDTNEESSFESLGTIIAIAALVTLSIGGGGVIWYVWRGQRSKKAIVQFRKGEKTEKGSPFRPSPLS